MYDLHFPALDLFCTPILCAKHFRCSRHASLGLLPATVLVLLSRTFCET